MNPAVCILSSDKMKQKEFSFFPVLCSFVLKSKQTSTQMVLPFLSSLCASRKSS